MTNSQTFDILILIARPAAGKSEIIDYLKQTPVDERRRRFHLGQFEEIDDFPMLWAWFEEDGLLAEMGQPRLHTDAGGYFIGDHLWDVLIRRICLEYDKRLADNPQYHQTTTTIIEFARGAEHGGFARAFDHLSQAVLERAAVLYLNVSYEESLRKNRRRFNPNRPHSILEHGLPDAKLERLYKESDWAQVSAAHPHYLTIQGRQVPYAVFENEDDVTTGRGPALGQRLEETLGRLWGVYQNKQTDSPRPAGEGIEVGKMAAAELVSRYEAGQRDFRGVDLSETDLGGVNLTGVDFSEANLKMARLNGANLSQANLSRANLGGAVLQRANLSQANLTGADLSWADLGFANLTGANLTGATLQMTILLRARLAGAIMPDGAQK